MTPTQEAAMRQALEAMLNFSDDISDDMFESIIALKAALAEEALERMSEDERKLGIQMQPVLEPVAWLLEYDNGERELRFKINGWPAKKIPLYTTPHKENNDA